MKPPREPHADHIQRTGYPATGLTRERPDATLRWPPWPANTGPPNAAPKSRHHRTIAKPTSLARTFNQYLENTKGIGEGVRGDELPGEGGKPPACLTKGI